MKWLCISRERREKVLLRLKVKNKREGKESKVKVGKLEGKFLLKSKRKIKEQKKIILVCYISLVEKKYELKINEAEIFSERKRVR